RRKRRTDTCSSSDCPDGRRSAYTVPGARLDLSGRHRLVFRPVHHSPGGTGIQMEQDIVRSIARRGSQVRRVLGPRSARFSIVLWRTAGTPTPAALAASATAAPAARLASPAPAASTVAGQAASPASGAYECFAFSGGRLEARLGLNFAITGPSQYA